MSWAAHLATATEIERDTFGVSQTWTLVGGSGPEVIVAPFDESAEVQSFDDDGVPIAATRPITNPRNADLSRAPRKRDLVTIAGTGYRVTQADPDNDGTTRCYLEEV
ncbi:MAG: hypothetical protein FJ087_16870 [Deltaproteobacteria bacterium]|nr:hypothetical protein [Deltaproteobacteria bacterium]